MSQSFIQETIELVKDNLGDPHTTRRLTDARILRDLHIAQRDIWERLLQVSGQEGSVGRAEATITIENGKALYALPGNFRHFISMERRLDGERNRVSARLPSIGIYDSGPGVEILSAERGMHVRPEPTIDGTQGWTLIYEKGPVPLHYAKAGGVSDTALVGGTPGTSAGEFVLMDNFYNASMVRVYQAGTGAPQTREVEVFTAETRTFKMRHAWDVKPTGEIWYEVRPALPSEYDHIYALKVAIMNCTRRQQSQRKRELQRDYKEAWFACINHFNSNVADRGPGRTLPYMDTRVDPYDGAW